MPDGLADPNVVVLDPCCGTGAYLVEVLRRIAATLRDKGGDALIGSDLKEAAMNRVFGFEILPAPFVVSHLQLGLMLQQRRRAALTRQGERAGVYLTNALTGWEPPKGPKATLPVSSRNWRKSATRPSRSNARRRFWSSWATRPTTPSPGSAPRRNKDCRARTRGPQQADGRRAAGVSGSSIWTIFTCDSSAWRSGVSRK